MSSIKRHKKNLLLVLTSKVFLVVVAALLVASYLTVYFNPAKAWYMTILGLFFVPLFCLNLCLFCWALLRHSKSAWIPLAALLPALLLLGKHYRFGSETEEEGDIKIVSYNVARFNYRKSDMKRRECMDSICTFLKETDADVICLQEFWFSDISRVRSFLRTTFKGYDCTYFVYSSRRGCYGNVTLCRSKALSKGHLDFDGSGNLAIYSDYEMDGVKFRVYNCHFQSYSISLPSVARSLARRDSKKVRETETKIRQSIVKRPRQVDLVLKDIESSPLKALVVGDFNDTPMSYTYHRLKKGRKDAFVEGGHGFGATYSILKPFLRIDYILFPKIFKGISYKTIHNNLSDHYPVVATLDVKK